MSDPNMILNWSQNQPNTLTNIGQGLRGLGGQVIDQVKNRRYEGLLETAMNPATESPENWIAALNAAPEAQKQNAIQTYGIMQQKKKAQIEADAKAQYDSALSTFIDDPSSEGNLMSFLESADAIGKFDEGKQKIAAMDSLAQKNELQKIMERYSQVYSGNTEMAIAGFEADATAYENDGDPENDGEIQGLRMMAQQLREGKEKESLALMGAQAGQLEGGPEALGVTWDINADYRAGRELELAEEAGERAAVASEGKLFELAQKNPFATEEDKQRFYETAEGLGLETASMLAELASVMSMKEKDPLTTDQFQRAETALRKEYDAYTGDFNKMLNSATQINRLAESGTGFGDQGMIMLFNKVLDPPSVVRESEAKMTADNQGIVAKGRTILSNLAEGDRLDPVARKELLDAVNAMSTLGNEQIAREKKRLMPSVKFYGFGEDRVFFGDEREEAPEVVKTPGIASVSNAVPQTGGSLSQKRAFVKQNNPQSNANFDTMTDDQLNQYKAGRAFNEQSPDDEIVEVNY